MLGYWRSHNDYCTFVLDRYKQYSTDMDLIREYLNIIHKLYILNLDRLKDAISCKYPNIGRSAPHQPEIFRIFILMTHLNLAPVECIKKLKQNFILRTACGLTRTQIPSVATLYNFIYRIVGCCDKPQLKRFRRKPSTKLAKGEKLPSKHPGITQKLKDKLLTGHRFNDPVATAINDILSVVVRQSYECGLLGPTVNVSGDGTCIPTGASPYGKKVCNCAKNSVYNCECARVFTDPGAAWGWDSHNEHFFFGYNGYFLSTHNREYKVDLPLYLRIVDARRHDSVCALVAFAEFQDLYPQLRAATFISDSASDNQATYEFLDFWGVDAVIALGKSNNGNFKYSGPMRFDIDGTPVCQSGHRMTYCGSCGDTRPRIKWRCPRMTGKLGDGAECTQCSPSPYGRTFYTKPEWDLRIFSRIPRGSEQWKRLMNERTAAERVNDRILNDYHAVRPGRRGKGRLSFYVLIAAVNVHLDAQAKASRAYDSSR